MFRLLMSEEGFEWKRRILRLVADGADEEQIDAALRGFTGSLVPKTEAEKQAKTPSLRRSKPENTLRLVNSGTSSEV
jgi:hypothetical protein